MIPADANTYVLGYTKIIFELFPTWPNKNLPWRIKVIPNYHSHSMLVKRHEQVVKNHYKVNHSFQKFISSIKKLVWESHKK
jgi:hypothetical protein